MDKTQQYIDLCRTARDLQKIKWKAGFVEGDWVFFGEEMGTHPIGCDLFQVGKTTLPGEGTEIHEFEFFKFADADRIVFDPDPRHQTIEVKTGRYMIETITNPIWLPRQDQMESFYYKKVANKIDTKGWLNTLLNFFASMQQNPRMEFTPKSNEQLAMAFIMNHVYKKVWNKKTGWTLV